MSRVLALLFFLCTLSLSCRRRNPQAVYDHAVHTFEHGEIAAAGNEAERGYNEFHTLGADWAWKFRTLHVNALIWRGMNDRALSLLKSETAPLPPGEMTVNKNRLEGLAYTNLHDFSQAELRFHEADQLCATANYSICPNVPLAEAGLEMERGRFAQAELIYKRALELAKSQANNLAEANALMSLGFSAIQQEHFDQALDWSDQAYKHSFAIGATNVVQSALGNEGWAYYKLGEHERALPLFLEATKQAHEIGVTTYELNWLNTAGYVYLDAHDYEKAQQSYLQSLDLAQQIKSKEDIINSLMSLALVAERTGKLEQARDYADKTIAQVPEEGNRLDILYPMLVKGRVAAAMHDASQAEQIFRQVEQDPKSHAFLKWEAEYSLAQLYENENRVADAEREYQTALSTFETARSALQEESELPFPSNASRIYDSYINFLVTQKKSAEALQVAEYNRARTLGEGLGLLKKGTTFHLDPLNVSQIARQSRGVILFYRLGEKQSYLWAVDAQQIKFFPLPPSPEIDAAVQKYRKTLIGSQNVLETSSYQGLALYRMLVEPAKDLLGNNKNAKVFIIPDGSLNALNFETLLVDDSKPHYWIEDVTLAEASSLRLLAASHANESSTAKKNAGNLLLFGDALAPADYPPLPQAALEIGSVEKHFATAQEKIFQREQATPPAYLASGPEQFSYIHFVAHGTASRVSPLDSAIVLSKSSGDNDSFKLYARDVMRHRLRADLVTVSTCYGAGARAYSGEGLVGLSWAFLHAGAHNVIGALWEVSDASTPQLMNDLYANLKKGETPAAALRDAKLSMLHSQSAFRKPFYWAPFQLYTGS